MVVAVTKKVADAVPPSFVNHNQKIASLFRAATSLLSILSDLFFDGKLNLNSSEVL